MTGPGSVKIAVSFLTADFTRLGEQVEEALAAGADYLHVDVMDGHFVPNLTVGPLVVAALKPVCLKYSAPVDVHLMIERPEDFVAEFAKAGADILTVHVEATRHLYRLVQQIKDFGIKAGVTLNPATSLDTLEELLSEVDLVLIMSVSPGFGGQSYLSGSTARIARVKRMLVERGVDQQVELEVDGGIKPENAARVVEAGATVLVAGSAIYNSQGSVRDNLERLRQAIAA